MGLFKFLLLLRLDHNTFINIFSEKIEKTLFLFSFFLLWLFLALSLCVIAFVWIHGHRSILCRVGNTSLSYTLDTWCSIFRNFLYNFQRFSNILNLFFRKEYLSIMIRLIWWIFDINTELHLQFFNLCIFSFDFCVIAFNEFLNHFSQLHHLLLHSLIAILYYTQFFPKLCICR